MQVPCEFEYFVKCFYPGSADGTTTAREWIERILPFHNEQARDVIRQFLDELLSDRHTDEEIEEVWRRQYPSYDFVVGGHRPFLAEARIVLG